MLFFLFSFLFFSASFQVAVLLILASEHIEGLTIYVLPLTACHQFNFYIGSGCPSQLKTWF